MPLIKKYFSLFLVVWLIACKEEVLEPIAPEEVIFLEVVSDTVGLRADGKSLLHIRSGIAPGAKGSFRTVVFTVSAGLGQFQGISTGTTQSVSVDEKGQAEAIIKVSTLPGTYYITAQIKEGDNVLYTAQEVAVTLSPIPSTQKLTLIADNTQPPADNTTTILLSVTHQFGADKTIKLTTDQGFFVNSSNTKEITLNLDDIGKATTLYRISNRVVNHIIQGTLPSNITTSLVIQPTPSLPDQLILEPSVSVVDTAGSNIELTVFLRKQNSGEKVSMNTAATFAAFQIINGMEQSVGRFTGTAQAVSDGQGKIGGVKFYADAGNVRKDLPIGLRVTVSKDGGGQLMQEIFVQVKK
jgi:hypothetical protein